MSERQSVDVAVDEIETDPQIRKKLDERLIKAIVLTIATVGVIDPIHVRRDGKRLVIVDGEHRWVAAKQAGRKTIPCIIEAGEPRKAEWLARQLIGNCLRAELNPIDKAHGIHDYMDVSGLNAAETANRLGLSASAVTEHLKLLSLPAELQQAVATGKIAASVGSTLAGVEDPEERAEFARQVLNGGLTRDALVGAIKGRKNGGVPKNGSDVNRATAVLGEGRSVTVIAKSLDMDVLIECLTNLLAEARKCRTRGVALSTFLRILKDQSHNATA